jgi:hypothetical protein
VLEKQYNTGLRIGLGFTSLADKGGNWFESIESIDLMCTLYYRALPGGYSIIELVRSTEYLLVLYQTRLIKLVSTESILICHSTSVEGTKYIYLK